MEREEEEKNELNLIVRRKTLLWFRHIENCVFLHHVCRIHQVASLASPPFVFQRWIYPSDTPVESSHPTVGG